MEVERKDSQVVKSPPSAKCKQFLNRRLPITEWLPRYRIPIFLRDMLAGLTVGLTEVPQGIAYASIAGLDPEYGLYAGFMGCFMYAIFGSVKDINIGPTAIMALMVQPHVTKMGFNAAITMTFLAGCIILLLGILHLGFIVDFFSLPVVAGFTCAAALQIASSQLKSLFGLSGQANEFLDSIIHFFENLDKIKLWDTVLGISSIIVLILMRELKRYGSIKNNPEWTTTRNVFGKIFWLLSLSRNALIVVFGALLAYCLSQQGKQPFTLNKSVGKGLPPFEIPPFNSTSENGTFYDFGEMIETYGSSIAFIPLISILESIAIAKAFTKGKTLDATQELIALGICNLMSSFVSSMPVTGSFTRTAVNNASGVKTTFGGILTGAMVLLALGFLTSTFAYIPKATLASVVITAMIYLFEYETIIVLWKTKKLDLIPFFITFLACLLIGLEYGILIGIGSNMVFVLYPVARPNLQIRKEKFSQTDIYIVEPIVNMQFPVAEFFKEKVIKECGNGGRPVILIGTNVEYIDSTVAKNFESLVKELKIRKQTVIFLNFNVNVISALTLLDPNLEQHCKFGTLEEVVNDIIADKPVDEIHSIQ